MKNKSLKLYGCIAIAIVLALSVLLCNFNVSYAYAAVATAESQQQEWTKDAVGNSVELLRQAPIEEIMKWDSYDSRSFGFVSNVKNQGQLNLCWSYGTLAAMEVAMRREGVKIPSNISSLWLAPGVLARATKGWFDDPLDLCDDDNPYHGQVIDSNIYDVGGNIPVVSLVASRWYGVYDLTDGTNVYVAAKEEYSPFRVESVVTCDNNETQIKELIATYGSAAFAYYASNLSGSYYYAPYNTVNHVSAIVGWDDNISADTFRDSRVTKSGAWIVKNSWGANLHDNGYFYMSYQSYITELTAFDMMDADDYDYNYNYAGNAPSIYLTQFDGRYNYGGHNDYIAAYKAQKGVDNKTEFLKGVSVGVKGKDVVADIKVYTNVNEDDFATFDPNATKPAAEIKKTFKYEGIYTVELPDLVEVEYGKYYLIYVNLSYGAGIIYEKDASRLSDNDLTFYNKGENNWENFKYAVDNSNSRTYGVASIKGLTVVDDDTRPSIANCEVELDQNTFIYNGSAHTPKTTVKLGGITLRDGEDYTLYYQDNTNAGQATVKIVGKGDYKGTVSKSFTIDKAQRQNFSVSMQGWVFGQSPNAPVAYVFESEKGYLAFGRIFGFAVC